MSSFGIRGEGLESVVGTAATSADDAFVVEMIPRVSRTFALSISLLPRALREPVGIGYLLCRIVDSIEDDASIDRVAREALFDAFDEALSSDRRSPDDLETLARREGLGATDAERVLTARAGAVFRAFRRLPRVQRDAIRPHVLEMSAGMREFAARTDERGAFRIDDVADLERYCYYVAGTVGLLLTELFELEVPELDEDARRVVHETAVAFGLGLQLVNIAKDVAEDAERGVCFLPVDRASALGLDLSRILDPEERDRGLALLEEVCDLAAGHLEAARRYTLAWPIEGNGEGEAVRLFCAVPLALAVASLREVRRGDDSLRKGKNPKVSRETVSKIVERALRDAGDDAALRELLAAEPEAVTDSAETTAERRAEALLVATDRASQFLRSIQAPEGFWKGELETNVTMDAEDLLLRQFLGIRSEEDTQAAARWIRSQQREDGTWSNARGGRADLSTTIEAYVALKLAGDSPELPHMKVAAAWVREQGGVREARVFTRIWLALFGLWPWETLPKLPPEMMLLPHWVPLNVYDFACWARQTVVAMTVVMSYRPVRPIGFDIDELSNGPVDHSGEHHSVSERLFARIDKALTVYERYPIRPLRERALAEAERWIVQRQEADGSWGGIQPPWVYSIMALTLRGYPPTHPVIKVGLDGLERFTIREDGVRRLEACQSPVWDTAYAVQALADAGAAPSDDALVRGAGWLLDQEVRQRGDWSVRRPDLPPGGWAFEFANVNYPDVDDTAEVIIALRRAAYPDAQRNESAIARGVRWLIGMQSKNGGWGAFDADNTQRLVRDIPFCDFGEVIDPPSADVTAHAVETLCKEGLVAHPATQAGIRWLVDHQEDDGSWFGRWGVNYVYGTGGVLMALAETDLDPRSDTIRRAVRWLYEKQNSDGGWGEDVRSYEDRSWAGRGTSTPSQTAWALLGLLAVGETGDAVRRGIDFLVARQRADGGWDEAEFTGTGFPCDFYINYHLYRQVFPTMALGRYARRLGLIQEAPKSGRGLVQLRLVRGEQAPGIEDA